MIARIANLTMNCTLALLTTLIGFVLLEVAYRSISNVNVFDGTNYVAQALDIARANSGALAFDERLGWTLKEGVEAAGFTTTAHGIRNNAAKRDFLPANAILAVGDSFTAGSGVTDEDTWPAQLERLVSTPTLNAGVGAYGVDQMVLRAELLAEKLRPKTLIIGILSQDSLRNAYDVYGGGMKPWFQLVNETLDLRNVPVRRFEEVGRGLGFARAVVGHSYAIHRALIILGYQQSWLDGSRGYNRVMTDAEAVNVSCALIRRLRDFAGTLSSELVIVMFWGAQEATLSTPPWYGAEVVACAKHATAKVLDLHPILHRISIDAPALYRRLWIDEGGVLGHPSKEGHSITAQHLRSLLSPR